jgi:CRISPR-associated protein Cmr6
MSLKVERPKIDYKFNNPFDTCEILYSEILKESKWEFNKKKNREEKKDWYYRCKVGFEKNIGLLFGRFIPKTLISKEESEDKDKYLNLIVNEFNNFKQKTNLLNFINARNISFLQKLQNYGFKIEPIKATCNWRLIIGLGASHPQETSMTLHHIYGIPYIPGSAVKGVIRHWKILKKFSELDISEFEQINCLEKILEMADLDNKDENKRDDKLSKEDFKKKFRVKNKDKYIEPDDKLYDFLISKQEFIRNFQRLFGTQQKKGELIFMDALPVEDINLKIDIMNPHYPDYYGKGEPPADWQNPTPIKFLTVENTKFQFYILSRSRNNELLDISKKLLQEALKEHGIGAKTSLGYGILEEK